MSTIIDSDDCRIFCNNCNRTITEGKNPNTPKISQDYCYHLINQSNKIASIAEEPEILFKIKNLFESISNRFRITRCDGRKV